ncbi:MAG: isoprenylcysteine carboxylmethyltransferase family protein, partial [Gammaproteobacteria bacterium]
MKRLQKVLPVFYLLAALLIMLLLDRYLPVLELIRPPYSWAGIAVLVSGLCLSLIGVNMFRKVGTPIMPFDRSTALVVEGLFGLSRNPMYLGLVVILFGAAILLGSLTPFLVIPVFVFIIQEGYIKYEEQFLEELFGETYREY